MLVIALIIAVIFLLWYFAPRGIGAHGAISADRLLPNPRFPMAAMLTEPSGDALDLHERTLVRVSGNSAREFGIRNGAILVTKAFDEKSRSKISPEDIIIINSVKDKSMTNPWRLRRIKRLYTREDGETMMEFYAAPSQDLNPKPLRDAVSWIEYVDS